MATEATRGPHSRRARAPAPAASARWTRRRPASALCLLWCAALLCATQRTSLAPPLVLVVHPHPRFPHVTPLYGSGSTAIHCICICNRIVLHCWLAGHSSRAGHIRDPVVRRRDALEARGQSRPVRHLLGQPQQTHQNRPPRSARAHPQTATCSCCLMLVHVHVLSSCTFLGARGPLLPVPFPFLTIQYMGIPRPFAVS